MDKLFGRFLQTDPIGYSDGINWYNYCRNNPVGRLDPFGLLSEGWWTADITGYVYIPETDNLWGITGTLNMDDLCGWLMCNPSDVTPLITSDGLPFWIVNDTYVDDYVAAYDNEVLMEPTPLGSELLPDLYPSTSTAEEVQRPPIRTPEKPARTSRPSMRSAIAIVGTRVGIACGDGPWPVLDAVVIGWTAYEGIRWVDRLVVGIRGTGEVIPGSVERINKPGHGGKKCHYHWLERHTDPKTGRTRIIRRSGPYPPPGSMINPIDIGWFPLRPPLRIRPALPELPES